MNQECLVRISASIRKELEVCRLLVLDLVEQECASSPRWSYIRNRLLRFLGDKGLQGNLQRVLDEEFTHSA